MSFSEWQTIKLGEICDVKGGKRLPKGTNLISVQNSHPYIRIRDMYQHKYLELNNQFEYVDEETFQSISRYIVNKGEVIIAIVGNTIGLVSMIGDSLDNASLTENCVKLINLKECLSEFLYYHLISDYGQSDIKRRIVGTSQPKLPIYNIQGMEIKLPPIPEQKAIAETLTCIDNKIELNNRINKTLEEMAQAIFKSWFVDFEPFQDGEFEDSELGKIPTGWTVKALGELVEIINGYSYKGSELKESDDSMMTIKNFDRNGGFKIDGFKEIEISERVKDRHYIDIFDVLVACTDLTQNAEIIGNPILVLTKSKYNNLIASMDLVKVVPQVSFIDNFLLYTLMKNEKFKQFALGYTSGTTVLHLNKKSILEYKIALPNQQHLLKDVSSIIEPLFKLMSKNINENRTLTITRDSLLQKLMSGEIRIPVEG